MKELKRQYTCKKRFAIKSKYTDKYFELLCSIICKKYNLTKNDLLNRNGGIGYIISKSKTIICHILRSEKGYSLNRTAKIFNTKHCHIYSFIKNHEKKIARNEFGYKEMLLDILSSFLYQEKNIINDKTCNLCVTNGFERYSPLKKRSYGKQN